MTPGSTGTRSSSSSAAARCSTSSASPRATAHRGIRHVRFPTTTLSQGDGGVGVKNGVNYFGKKNWVGTFAVPYAVVNDFAFLDTLPAREKRCGLIEAIKVALIRDADFFLWLEKHVEDLAALKPSVVEQAVQRSAELHVEHIATNGDPFEQGSARPLDFGHWAAHKLEQASGFKVAHGEAVAIGMAVDLLYSVKAGILDAATARARDRAHRTRRLQDFRPGTARPRCPGRTHHPRRT